MAECLNCELGRIQMAATVVCLYLVSQIFTEMTEEFQAR